MDLDDVIVNWLAVLQLACSLGGHVHKICRCGLLGGCGRLLVVLEFTEVSCFLAMKEKYFGPCKT